MKKDPPSSGIIEESRAKRFLKGFTLIELLVVLSIISLLSSIGLAALNDARAKSRDARRKSDLVNIRTALILYYDKFGNYIQSESGCGWNGDGNGWFNYSGPSYPASTMQCLINGGIVGQPIIDPTGGVVSTPSSGFTYMKYSSGGTTYLYAKLEKISQSNTATDGTLCSDCDSLYGMNYYIRVQ